VSKVLTYDEAASRRVAAIYATPEVRVQRQQVLRLLSPRSGERVLDIGCGPGYLVCEIAAQVAPSGSVCGIDVSDDMLAIAQTELARAPAGTRIELRNADATALPFDDAAFDAGAATQVYEFVDHVAVALGELYRVLRPGGRAAILDTDWGSVVWHSTDDDRMRRVLDAWRQRLAHPHLPRTLSPRLRRAGFDIARREVFPIFDPHGGDGSYSARQLDHIAAALADPSPDAADVEAWAEELRALADSEDYFFSLNRYLFLATKPR
jgi:arsenite methyltransferase